MDISELEHFLLGPEDADISITTVSENTRDEGAYSKFVLFGRLEAKEQVEAFKRQMRRVLPKQQGKSGDVKRHLQ